MIANQKLQQANLNPTTNEKTVFNQNTSEYAPPKDVAAHLVSLETMETELIDDFIAASGLSLEHIDNDLAVCRAFEGNALRGDE